MYDDISKRIETKIAEWQKKYGYSPSDHGVYYDAHNLPYMKDGTIQIVVHDCYYSYDSNGALIGSPVPTKTPYFDYRFNRIVVPKAALERMRLGEVQILRDGGNINNPADWHNLTLTDTIIHEPGHRGESVTPNYSAAVGAKWGNTILDSDAEYLQMMGRIVQGLGGNDALSQKLREQTSNGLGGAGLRS